MSIETPPPGHGMRLKAPRWLLILEAVFLAGALLTLAYKAVMWVPPLPTESVAQTRLAKRPDPQAQLLGYYRDYPDRYLRIADETWSYNPVLRTAFHSFTLRNIATVAYGDIEITFSYQASTGKALLTRTVKVKGPLSAFTNLDIKKMKVTGVPDATKSVVTTVTKALVVQ
jgi:hypothetical protein